MTKTEMAQVIVQALYNMPKLPHSQHHAVKRQVRIKNHRELSFWYPKARIILGARDD